MPTDAILENQWVARQYVNHRSTREGTAMNLRRRQFLHLATSVAALPAVSRIAGAQSYPTRPVRLIVGFPPGGAADTAARIMGHG
jgi:hypothetical protein